jgi:hypothetical protein
MAPFSIGQKVICLYSSSTNEGFVVKDKIYTIEGINQCPDCGHWRVDVGLRTFPAGIPVCFKCNSELKRTTKIIYADAALFAPAVQDYLDIRKEIADTFFEVKEISDANLQHRKTR